MKVAEGGGCRARRGVGGGSSSVRGLIASRVRAGADMENVEERRTWRRKKFRDSATSLEGLKEEKAFRPPFTRPRGDPPRLRGGRGGPIFYRSGGGGPGGGGQQKKNKTTQRGYERGEKGFNTERGNLGPVFQGEFVPLLAFERERKVARERGKKKTVMTISP